MGYEIFKKDVSGYFWQLIFVIVLGVLAGVSKSAPAMLVNELITVWNKKPFDTTKALQLPFLITLVLLLSNVARYYSTTGMRLLTERICLNLRLRLLDKYLFSSLDVLSGDSSGRGGLMSRMLQDIGIIQTGYGKIAEIIKEPIVFVVTLAYIFYLNPYLSLILFVTLPIIFYVLNAFIKSLKKYSKKNLETLGNLAQTLKESLDGSKVIRSYNLEQKIRSDFSIQIEQYFKSKKKIIQKEELSGPISEAIVAVSFTTILILIGRYVSQGHMNMADFTSYVVAVGFCTDAGRKIQTAIVKIQQSLVARERLEELLQKSSTIVESKDAVSFPKIWNQIKFENVSYKVDDTYILKNINLKINKGETIALVGYSGSGKTTLINLLERFIDPTEGGIFIGDVNIKDIKISELREHIGLVSQDVFLFNDTIKNNIIYGSPSKNVKIDDVENASRLAFADRFIFGFPEKYETKVGDGATRLSGGEKQRISIARALLKNSEILLMDEATSALDNQSEHEVQKSLNSLMDGRTSIIIAHRLSTISKVNTIYVMNQGQIVQQGSHEVLSTNEGLYKDFLKIAEF